MTELSNNRNSSTIIRHWFVAFVGTNREKACRDQLVKLGHEAWVASQQEERQWRNGRRTNVERVVIPLMVFVHATERERLEIVRYPFIKYFLTDKSAKANNYGVHPVAVINDGEMEKLRFMLYQCERPVTFVSHAPRAGETVRVLRGQLRGLEGQVTRYRDGDTYLVANIGILGCAMVRISLNDVEPV